MPGGNGIDRPQTTNRPSSSEVNMTDSTTHERLCVSTAEKAGPFIMLPEEQVTAVCALLDANQIKYWVDEHAISSDGGPEFTFINLSSRTDPAQVQRILDSVP